MWTENPIHLADLQEITANPNIPWGELKGKTIFVTGGTGLIGLNLINSILYYGKKAQMPPKVVALVRSAEKANALYAKQLEECGGCLQFLVGDVTDLPRLEMPIDYIIHGASQTASAAFVAQPVETIETALRGTRGLLELAREKQVRSLLYLSSMEAYGAPHEDVPLREEAGACFDSMSVRSCYPESKRMCESLCAAYAAEYQVPAKVVRLAQTFGPGVVPTDARVFADFARKAVQGQDIVMQTMGDSCRMYLYTMDAASALLTILLKGENGKCYNAANKDTYCSIREMAELVSQVLSEGRSRVILPQNTERPAHFSPVHRLKLDTTRLEELGWMPSCDLAQMYQRMMKGLE